MYKCGCNGHYPLNRNDYPPIALNSYKNTFYSGKNSSGNSNLISFFQYYRNRIEINELIVIRADTAMKSCICLSGIIIGRPVALSIIYRIGKRTSSSDLNVSILLFVEWTKTRLCIIGTNFRDFLAPKSVLS